MMECAYMDYLCHEVCIERDDVYDIAQSGSNDAAVAEVCDKEYIQEQFLNFSDRWLINAANALVDGGVDSRRKAIEAIVWMAAWDIAEELD